MSSEIQSALLRECVRPVRSDAYPADRMADYLRRREELSAAVSHEAGKKKYALLGSWQTGQFHLAMDASRTMSDVDAWSGEIGVHRVDSLLVRTTSDVLDIRLSVHPYNYQKCLSLEAQKILALLNIAASGNSLPYVRSYAQHKAFLVIARHSPAETYLDVARRLGSSGIHALHIKVGLACGGDESFCAVKHALVAGICDITGLRGVDLKLDLDKVRMAAVDLLQARTLMINPVFRAYLLRKYCGLGDDVE